MRRLARDADRGQLLLVGAIAFALALIGLGVLLNSMAYSRTVTANTETDAGGPVIEYRNAVEEGVGGLLFYANYYNRSGYATLATNVSVTHHRWQRRASTHYAVEGVAATGTFERAENGSLLYQNESGAFASADGDADWTLVDDANGTRRFRLNVSTGTLAALSDVDEASDLTGEEAFHVEFSNGSASREYYVYDDGQPTVAVVNDSDRVVGSCTGSGSWLTVDLTAGTVDGEPCPVLSAPGIDGPYDVAYDEGDDVSGRYVLVVDRERDALPDDAFTEPDAGGTPHAAKVLFSATVHVAYRSPTVGYEANVTIEPESTPRGPVYGYPVEPLDSAPCGESVVFTAPGDGQLHTIDTGGTITTYDADSVAAIGPKKADFDGDGLKEVPYVTGSRAVRTVDANNETRTLATDARQTKTVLGVGTWGNANFETRTAVYYVNDSDHDIWRAWYDESTDTVHQQELRETDGDGDGIKAIAGVRDYNGDGDTDVVFTDGSQHVTYMDGGTTHETDEGVGSNNGLGVGSPCDFDGDGSLRAPIVDGSNNVALLPPSGTSEDLTSSGPAAKSPVAAVDWDESAAGVEVMFVGTGETLHYVTGSGTIVQVTDASGDPVAVDDDQGVA